MISDLNPRTDFVPAEFFVVNDLETLKVLADPLRLRIRELMYEPTTVKHIAAELSIPATKLYYHINLLEKHGLIVLVDTRIVSGIIEKHYQMSAHAVRVARHLLSPAQAGTENMNATISTLFDSVREELTNSLQAGLIDIDDENADPEAPRRLVMGSFHMMLTDDQIAEFEQSLRDLIAKYRPLSDAQLHAADAKRYAMLVAMFPTGTTIISEQMATSEDV